MKIAQRSPRHTLARRIVAAPVRAGGDRTDADRLAFVLFVFSTFAGGAKPSYQVLPRTRCFV
jgi:hypothetical protein